MDPMPDSVNVSRLKLYRSNEPQNIINDDTSLSPPAHNSVQIAIISLKKNCSKYHQGRICICIYIEGSFRVC